MGFPHLPKQRIPYLRSDHHQKLFAQGTVITEKLDGALANVFIRNEEESGANSHRLSKKTNRPIDYSRKVPGLAQTTLPATLHKTELNLKGEFLLIDKQGKVLPHQEISGYLNSKDETATKKLLENSWKPIIALFDIWDDNRDYQERYKDVKTIARYNTEVFIVPEIAITDSEKKKMMAEIEAGKNPLTREGVIWNGSKKVKFHQTNEVFIHSAFAAIAGSKYENKAVGGLNYSIIPGGRIIGKVGTGFSDELRKEIYNQPKKYIGRMMLIEHQGQYETTKAYRTPVFKKFL